MKEENKGVGTNKILNRVEKSTKLLIFRKKYIVPHGVLTPRSWDIFEKIQLREGAAQKRSESEFWKSLYVMSLWWTVQL